jgi:hypothetical protein
MSGVLTYHVLVGGLEAPEWQVLIVDYPPHIPNLAHQVISIREGEHLAGKLLAAESNLQHTIVSWLKAVDTNFFQAGMRRCFVVTVN